MELVVPSYFFVPTAIIIALVAFYWIIVRGITFHIWQRDKLKAYPEDDKSEWNFKQFKHYHDEAVFIYKAVIIVICIICCIIMACALSQIYKNHKLEEATYNQYQTEYNTLTDILDSTTDVVNSAIYLRVNEYNKEISTYKVQYNTPAWRYNFTGNIDWNKLNLINVKGES